MQVPRITPSMAVALTALVLAASGGAYAASGGTVGSTGHAAKKKATPLTRSQIITLINQQLNSRNAGPGPTGMRGPTGPTGPT